jgi:molybdopterin converting factor small subunit
VSVQVQLPPVLRSVMGGERWLNADGDTLAAIAGDLARRYPTLGLHLLDERGDLRHNIVFLHDGEMVRAKQAGERSVRDGDEVVMTNALAGG